MIAKPASIPPQAHPAIARALALLLLFAGSAPLSAAPVRVSFLDTEESREDTLRAFAQTGCDPNNLSALRKAIVHYYRTPLALDVSALPPARDGFRTFSSVDNFLSALGTNQLSFLDHPFELNCFHAALLLAEPEMDSASDLESLDGTYAAVQVSANFNEWVRPVASLGNLYSIAHSDAYEASLQTICGMDFSRRHRTLLATFYQFHPLPLSTTSNAVPEETRAALRRHWKRSGVRFPANLSLVMLHRARADFHLALTDHAGILLKRDRGWLYFEKTGGKGPFLRLDVEDPADVAAYLSTGTWPDYPFNSISVNGAQFLDVPLRNRPAPEPPSAASRAKNAVRRRYAEISPSPPDSRGYAASPQLNLVPGVRLENLAADFAQGSGNELAGKFLAPHSSSALAANVFGPWRSNPRALRLFGETGFDFLRFEMQCPTGLGGIPPNLDLLAENSNLVVGVESKFLEILSQKRPKFSSSYSRENLPLMEECWTRLMDDLKHGPEQCLDAAQLVRHYLGLRNRPGCLGKRVVLLYVFWEPENWADLPEYRRHRAELAAFSERVRDSAVEFAWISYPELWRAWESIGFAPAHVRELRKRYSFPL